MKVWQKALIITLVTVIIGGIYLFSVFQSRKKPGVVPQKQENQGLSSDDLAVVRTKSIIDFSDARQQLEGTNVWMKNGYTMPYYAFEDGHVAFTKRIGLIPPDQKLEIKKVVKAAPPAKLDDGIAHGTHQIFAVFSMPGSQDQYATAIGVIDGTQEKYYCNLLFYYDDPHSVYDNWSKDTWAAIDAHQVKPGMNELQARTALGQKIETNGGSEGNRTLTYDANGKHWTVTFENDKATTVKSE